MVKSCNGKQYKMLLFPSWTIRTKSKSDCYVILHNQRVVRVSNIVRNKEGVFLIGQRFMQKSDSFLHPLKSSRLGVYCVERLSPLQRWSLTEVKCKAICLPKSINNRQELHVYPFLLQRNWQKRRLISEIIQVWYLHKRQGNFLFLQRYYWCKLSEKVLTHTNTYFFFFKSRNINTLF